MALSASQRVRLILDISSRLGVEEYSLIDVTLRQFSLPYSDQWSGTKEAYVLQMIENGQDHVLIELARHLGCAVDNFGTQRVDPPFWKKGMYRVFISHLAKHRAFAGELKEELLRYGISSFVAHNDIEPTAEWQAQIETALASCDALVAVLHPEFHVSSWTDQEIGFAMGRGIPVFSVRVGQDPYGFIGRFQAFNGNGKDAFELARELFNAYRKNKQTQQRMSESLVSLFEESSSYSEARTNIGYLEQLDVWDPSFSERILSSVKNNYQVSQAYGVAGRVEKLAEKWKRAGG